MATETLKKLTCSVRLENGTDSSGNVKTVLTSIGTMAKNAWNADKALSIVGALAPCLNKTVNSVEKGTTSSVSAA